MCRIRRSCATDEYDVPHKLQSSPQWNAFQSCAEFFLVRGVYWLCVALASMDVGLWNIGGIGGVVARLSWCALPQSDFDGHNIRGRAWTIGRVVRFVAFKTRAANFYQSLNFKP